MAKGIPPTQIRATTWGIAVEVAGIEVQPVECHHWSQIQMPDGTFASGVPMAFVVYADPGRALLPLRRHGALQRPEADRRAVSADDRLRRASPIRWRFCIASDARRDADRRDEPARRRAGRAMAGPEDRFALSLYQPRLRRRARVRPASRRMRARVASSVPKIARADARAMSSRCRPWFEAIVTTAHCGLTWMHAHQTRRACARRRVGDAAAGTGRGAGLGRRDRYLRRGYVYLSRGQSLRQLPGDRRPRNRRHGRRGRHAA